MAGAAEDPEGRHAAAPRAAGVGRAARSVRGAAAARRAGGRVATAGRLGTGLATAHRRWAAGRDPDECYGNDRRDDDHGSTHWAPSELRPLRTQGRRVGATPCFRARPALCPLLRSPTDRAALPTLQAPAVRCSTTATSRRKDDRSHPWDIRPAAALRTFSRRSVRIRPRNPARAGGWGAGLARLVDDETVSVLSSHRGPSRRHPSALRADVTAEGRVLDAAKRCWERWGMAKVTVDDIAAEAGISRATLYRLFPGGKDVLYEALRRRDSADFFTELEAHVDRGRVPRGPAGAHRGRGHPAAARRRAAPGHAGLAARRGRDVAQLRRAAGHLRDRHRLPQPAGRPLDRRATAPPSWPSCSAGSSCPTS